MLPIWFGFLEFYLVVIIQELYFTDYILQALIDLEPVKYNLETRIIYQAIYLSLLP
ncbi:hypothetical protein SAMN04488491_1593 [Psychrobacter sp. LV10R520-6]|nr:hypothetical protein SAMN04488491_1593 [Psychrobacter sp. LV10R520-6]